MKWSIKLGFSTAEIKDDSYLKYMAGDTNVIALKLEQVEANQKSTDQKIGMLKERVLNPETGIFAKLKVTDMQSDRNREDVEDLHDSVDKLLAVCQSHDKSVSAIEGWMRSHEDRDELLRSSINTLTNTVKEYTDWTEEKFEQHDKEMKPLNDDFTIRNSNKSWKDKLLWIVITGLVTALALPPIVNLFGGNYQEKPKVETKTK